MRHCAAWNKQAENEAKCYRGGVVAIAGAVGLEVIGDFGGGICCPALLFRLAMTCIFFRRA